MSNNLVLTSIESISRIRSSKIRIIEIGKTMATVRHNVLFEARDFIDGLYSTFDEKKTNPDINFKAEIMSDDIHRILHCFTKIAIDSVTVQISQYMGGNNIENDLKAYRRTNNPEIDELKGKISNTNILTIAKTIIEHIREEFVNFLLSSNSIDTAVKSNMFSYSNKIVSLSNMSLDEFKTINFEEYGIIITENTKDTAKDITEEMKLDYIDIITASIKFVKSIIDFAVNVPQYNTRTTDDFNKITYRSYLFEPRSEITELFRSSFELIKICDESAILYYINKIAIKSIKIQFSVYALDNLRLPITEYIMNSTDNEHIIMLKRHCDKLSIIVKAENIINNIIEEYILFLQSGKTLNNSIDTIFPNSIKSILFSKINVVTENTTNDSVLISKTNVNTKNTTNDIEIIKNSMRDIYNILFNINTKSITESLITKLQSTLESTLETIKFDFITRRDNQNEIEWCINKIVIDSITLQIINYIIENKALPRDTINVVTNPEYIIFSDNYGAIKDLQKGSYHKFYIRIAGIFKNIINEYTVFLKENKSLKYDNIISENFKYSLEAIKSSKTTFVESTTSLATYKYYKYKTKYLELL